MFEYTDVLIVLVGIAAGFINVVAAGGSLLSLPLLIFLGFPATVANATNRVGIFFQNLIGISVYVKNQSLDFRVAKKYIIPAMLGAVAGSYLAAFLDDEGMKKVIAIVMLVMGLTMLINPKKWLEGASSIPSKKLSFKEAVTFFSVGVYGGFIQAGVGIFLLAGLVLVGGFSLVKSNPIKIFLAFSYTALSIIVFSYYNLIDWKAGFTLAIGSMIGGWLGAKLSLKWGSNFIRWMLILVIIVSSSKLLGLW